MKGSGKINSFFKFTENGIAYRVSQILRKIAVGSVVVVIIGLIIEYSVCQPLSVKKIDLLIICNIDEARISIDKTFFSRTIKDSVMVIGKFKPGTYVLEVEKNGYESQQLQVALETGQKKATYKVLLKVKSPRDTLEKNQSFPLTIVVPHEYYGAVIYIDKIWVATAPATVSLVKGRHILEVIKDQKIYQEQLLVTDKMIRSILPSEFRDLTKPSLD